MVGDFGGFNSNQIYEYVIICHLVAMNEAYSEFLFAIAKRMPNDFMNCLGRVAQTLTNWLLDPSACSFCQKSMSLSQLEITFPVSCRSCTPRSAFHLLCQARQKSVRSSATDGAIYISAMVESCFGLPLKGMVIHPLVGIYNDLYTHYEDSCYGTDDPRPYTSRHHVPCQQLLKDVSWGVSSWRREVSDSLSLK